MQKDLPEYLEIKKYLLGQIDPIDAVERIEQKLMLDDNYYENILAIEEDLIQSYVDDELPTADKLAFEKHFLISNDRRKKVNFAKIFRTYLDGQETPGQETTKPATAGAEKKFSRASWFSIPAFRIPAIAVAVLGVAVAGFFAWNNYIKISEYNRSLALLNSAQKNQRTVKSRITALEHAPYIGLRGDGKPNINETDLRRADSRIQEAAAEDPSAANYMLLGRLYLVKRDFDEAIKQLETALEMTPDDASILNDLGVAKLEKSRLQNDDGVRTELELRANENFSRAIAKNPGLLEAKFNHACSLEALDMRNEAMEVWRDYLRQDPASGWAKEAGERLRELEKQVSATPYNDNQLQDEFLQLADARSDDETLRSDKAFRLVSRDRDLINKKYLPQKLAMSFIAAPETERPRFLAGMNFLGKLEKERMHDNYAQDLAEFYAGLSPAQINLIGRAQAAMDAGYASCLNDNFTKAAEEFSGARDLFLQAGNEIEANAISGHFIAYCLYNKGDKKKAYDLLMQVDEYASARKYEWIAAVNRDWLIGAKASLGYSILTEMKSSYLQSLAASEKMEDSYMIQKSLRSLLSRAVTTKQEPEAYAYLGRLLKISAVPKISLRQKARGFENAIQALIRLNFPATAKNLVNEAIKTGEAINNATFVINAKKNGGSACLDLEEYDLAEKLLLEAKAGLESQKKNALNSLDLADTLQSLGQLETKKQRYDRAISYFDSSIEIQQALKAQSQQGLEQDEQKKVGDSIALYETRKLRLFAYQAAGYRDRMNSEIPAVLALAEDYRNEITEEDERSEFFNYEQDVYDIAINHEAAKNNFAQAYNYTEISNSRSLLDWLSRDVSGALTENAQAAVPLTINEIREKMSPDTQILQYAVVNEQVLIWAISKNGFTTVTSTVGAKELKKKVTAYRAAIEAREPEEKLDGLSRELYTLLIAPAMPYLDKNFEVCIVPSKTLFRLPFGALKSPEGKYFLEDFTFFYSPSSNIFILSSDEAVKRNSPAEEKLLSVGNPAFDRQKLSGLANLPNSAAEAREIALNYSNPILLFDKDATKGAFKQNLAKSDVLHFAGHYIVNPGRPLLSELVMANNSDRDEESFLTNADLMAEKLPRTRLVVLSACQTGVEGYYNGEGMFGLARTFIALGVPLAVASQWPVETDGSAELMKKFHSYRKKENLSTTKALRKAQLEMLREPDGRFAAPFYWAAFAVFGGHASF